MKRIINIYIHVVDPLTGEQLANINVSSIDDAIAQLGVVERMLEREEKSVIAE